MMCSNGLLSDFFLGGIKRNVLPNKWKIKMQVTDNDPNLWKLDSALFLKLQNALDENETYKHLLEVIPPRYTKNLLLHIEIEGCKPCSTPAKIMLRRLGSQGVTLSMIIKWLERIDSENILMFLKDDEPLNITVHPPESIEIVKNTDLNLTCKAISFPSPKYQWFKGNDELLLQQQSELVIYDAREEDSGTYICRVHTISRRNGNCSYAFSTPTNVTVVSKCSNYKGKPFKAKNCATKNVLNDLSKQLNTCVVTRRTKWESLEPINSKITIFRQPVDKVKIAHGGSILLTCDAHCDYPLKYQWYCNGRLIPEATSPEFFGRNIKPDPNTGETKWDYQCEIYHDYDKVLSRSVNVELLPADENTQYFASEKVAILIANDNYSNMEPLYTPANDVISISELLYQMGFKIFALRNLTYQQMLKAVQLLCGTLCPKAYVVVYFAGHGFELCRQVYLQSVDTQEEVDLGTCLCVDFILECLQEHDPALNVLLIDTCRTQPFKEGQYVSLGRAYVAETKANTVFGFSTSSMCPSHECDGETNSFFMKYLKEFLPQKMKIQDILYNVQCKFKLDSLVRNIQRPFVGSNLQESRSLHDEIENSDVSVFEELLGWTDLKGSLFLDWVCDVQQYDIEILLEFHHHRGVFCNGMDIHVSLDIGEDAPLEIIDQMEFTLQFASASIQECVTKAPCEIKNEVNAICKQTIYELTGLQNSKDVLDFQLLINHIPSERILLKKSVTLGRHPVWNLNLNGTIPNICSEMNIKHDENEGKSLHSPD